METSQLCFVDAKGPCKVVMLNYPSEAQIQVETEASE